MKGGWWTDEDGANTHAQLAFIDKHYIPKQEVKAAIEKRKMTMDAALKSGSDAGAGYTIGNNHALSDLLSDLNLQD